MKKNGLNINNCYGKICLVEIGKTLGADKMLTGSVESFGDAIVYTMRLIDVKNDMIEAAQVTEFLAIPNELQTMTAVMLKQLFKKKTDPNVLSQLIRPDGYDARTREPVAEQIRLDGPRMGAAYFTGMAGKILQAPKSEGGYDVYPVMFQFGYQFEKQYLASGQFQALFEFIPMITGLDQGLFIPSLTLMNGMRANKYGIELGFGPTFAINRTSRGFYDRSGNWHLSHEYNSLQDPTFIPTYVERMDSRGSCKLNTAFVFAVGKTFRSGNMNIPVNAFFVPGRNGWRVGLSLGYNIRYRRK
ncbi:MAG: hypothetical protein Fur0041_17930 [Bacteroidia bacterium]